MSHVFGPVPSRRLGRSLGVDLVPFKTCTYDCIYCQLGRTTCRTTERTEWVPLADVLADVEARIGCGANYVTLSGSGEPTLYSRAGELIEGIQAMGETPVAVLTNGSLLWREDVRAELMGADLIVPSLDAGGEGMFQAVNRPAEGLSFEQVVAGLAAFRAEFPGEYWLEVMLLGGHTGIESEVERIAECVEAIRPDRVQLNTVTRPPAEDFARPVPREELHRLAELFHPTAEVICGSPAAGEAAEADDVDEQQVLALLRRRPCRVRDIAEGLSMRQVEVLKYLEKLDGRGLLVGTRMGAEVYYSATKAASE
jgi:wyosine [tRNA(Phe)-imidazoG37] synthetase (radical SAM superfamily)